MEGYMKDMNKIIWCIIIIWSADVLLYILWKNFSVPIIILLFY